MYYKIPNNSYMGRIRDQTAVKMGKKVKHYKFTHTTIFLRTHKIYNYINVNTRLTANNEMNI